MLVNVNNRAAGAVAIAVAGVLFGFTIGRTSAWLVPARSGLPGDPISKPSIPVQTSGMPKRPLVAEASKEARADTKPADTKPQGSPDISTSASTGVASRALSPAEPRADTGSDDRAVTLINPGAAQKQDRPTQSRTAEVAGEELQAFDGNQGPLERCRSRYRSFDPSDGTYKPFGGDQRVRCPFLR